jgi:hypothetical protein
MNAPQTVRGKLNLFEEKYLLVSYRPRSMLSTEQGHGEMRLEARPYRRRRWQTLRMLALADSSVIAVKPGIQFKNQGKTSF